jgi:hypothetical protein
MYFILPKPEIGQKNINTQNDNYRKKQNCLNRVKGSENPEPGKYYAKRV